MDRVSPELEQEIQRRLAAGPYTSADELLRQAFAALDSARDAAQEILERELLRGLQGEDVDMTAADWEEIEREALRELEAKKRP